VSAVTNHGDNDNFYVDILDGETQEFWKFHKGAQVYAIRTSSLIKGSGVVLVRRGDKYRQWNAVFDADYAAALGKLAITLHDESLTHALKEVNGAALAVTETPEQIVCLMTYALEGRL
jgi:YtoQ family protein